MTRIAVIDATAIFDALTGRNPVQNMVEKRTAIELFAYVHDTMRDGTVTRWVHGESNLADSLTKTGAAKLILEFMETSSWLTVYDEQSRSAKKRKKDKLGRVEEKQDQAEDFIVLLHQ